MATYSLYPVHSRLKRRIKQHMQGTETIIAFSFMIELYPFVILNIEKVSFLYLLNEMRYFYET